MGYAELYGDKQFHAALERDYPIIEWRTPVNVGPLNPDDGKERIGCRYCIAAFGLKGSALGTTPFLFDDKAGWKRHLEHNHPFIKPNDDGEVHVN